MSTEEPLHVSRRTVVVAAAGASLLAACGSGSGGGGAAPSASQTASAGPTGASQGPVAGLVATAQVPVQGGVIVQDAKGNPVVVVQPASGQFKAYSAICTHAGCTVAQVQQNQILCPCHFSVFSATDGSVVSGPAPAPLSPVAVKVAGAEVVES